MARARFGLIFAVALWLAAPSVHAGITLPLSQPSWAELNGEQKRILAPLSSEWDKMEGFRRKKWIGIAQRYPSLSADEQARIQRRMTDWAKLTPDERKRARDKYKALQKDAPEQKEAVKQKWQEYKELPESEKNRLKAEATRKPTPRPAPSKQPVAAAKPPTIPTPPPVDPAAPR
jgi:hypothetical protein